MGKWIAEKMHKHANLRRDNADYAFTGLLYQLLQFEPFSTYLGIPDCFVQDGMDLLKHQE